MKTTYEGMFIFPKALSDDELDAAMSSVREEVEKMDGAVTSTTRLGRRPFARPMKKQDAGHYAVFTFDLEGEQISPLLARFKLNDAVMRVQIVRVDEKAAEAGTTAVAEEAQA